MSYMAHARRGLYGLACGLLCLTLSPAGAARIAPGQGPTLGVIVQEVPFERLESLDIAFGVTVRAVAPGSAAGRAGLEPGDLLVSFGGEPVYSPARLQWLVERAPTGEPIELKVRRDGEPRTLEVTLAAPSAQVMPGPAAPGGEAIARLGIRMQGLTDSQREPFGAPPGQGVLVAEVVDEGPAAAAGVRAGDVLIRIDRREIGGPRDVYRALHFFDPGDEVELELVRDGERQTLTANLGSRTLPRRPHFPRGWHPMPMPMTPFQMPPWQGAAPFGYPEGGRPQSREDQPAGGAEM